ncbi:MAG: hypothetical protein J6O88_10285 [Chryseobacterium sp.]|uniref:hypothetical protein n=1 Tax=Chryseobacterium sp. TaxID=1871047 RepID=UPI001B00B1C6|nr:hypothetical protein [Chryseobacterium sp.]MBO6185054.1 hypothetical protein [Chryseobacterium sp.]
MKKIRIDVELKKQISNELNISLQSVRMSLEYVFNSDNAKKVRKMAKELLIKEAENIKI